MRYDRQCVLIGPMVLGVEHVQITIPLGEEERAREFYCGLLGLKEIEKPDNRKKNGGFWLQVGETQVHVGVEEGVERLKTKAHVAYEVSHLKMWQTKLQESKIEIVASLPFPTAQAFEFRDPFGNRVEFIQNR